jgi:hypothetical protein
VGSDDLSDRERSFGRSGTTVWPIGNGQYRKTPLGIIGKLHQAISTEALISIPFSLPVPLWHPQPGTAALPIAPTLPPNNPAVRLDLSNPIASPNPGLTAGAFCDLVTRTLEHLRYSPAVQKVRVRSTGTDKPLVPCEKVADQNLNQLTDELRPTTRDRLRHKHRYKHTTRHRKTP